MGLRLVLTAALVASGCGVQLEDAANQGGDGVDAGSTGGDGGGGGVLPDAGLDAPACANGRVVYLNFEGVALVRNPSDATQNHASWMTINNGAAPAYRANSSTRDADIQAITTGIRQQLAAFPIAVVTERPAAGPYVMIVFGGTAQNVGSRFGGAVNALDCSDTQKSDVAWISDGVQPTQRVINYAIGAIGFGLGLSATTDPNDCMCGWDNGCVQNTNVACTISGTLTRDPNANQQCAGVTTQNAQQAFSQAFCQ